MNVLLDTNAFLWQAQTSAGGRLGAHSKSIINTADNVYVSAITIVELRIKSMLGRIEIPLDCQELVLNSGNQLLDFSATDADEITAFKQLVRHDPFDRMILAQASTRNLTLITSDRTLLGLKLPFIIDALK